MQFYLKDGPTHLDTHTDVLLKRALLPEKEKRAGGRSLAGYLPMAVQPGPHSRAGLVSAEAGGTRTRNLRIAASTRSPMCYPLRHGELDSFLSQMDSVPSSNT